MNNSLEVLEILAENLTITERRKAQLDLDNKRIVINHSLTLHRDKASAKDLKEMIAHLESAGMPENATLQVDGNDRHTRVYARWAEAEPVEVDEK